jgi:hypothetical protein
MDHVDFLRTHTLHRKASDGDLPISSARRDPPAALATGKTRSRSASPFGAAPSSPLILSQIGNLFDRSNYVEITTRP